MSFIGSVATNLGILYSFLVRKKAVAKRRYKSYSRRFWFEQLEGRFAFANGANWSVTGTTLNIGMMTGKTITVAATPTTYTFTVSGSGTDTNTWTTGTSSYVTSSGAITTVNASGKTNLTQINITEVSGQTGTIVAFADSTTNTYDTPITVTLGTTLSSGSIPGAVTFSGTTSFSSNKSLVVETTKQIVVSAGATVQTINGNLTFKANVADTTVAGTSFSGAGVDINGGTVQVTGTGILDLKGRGGDGSNTTPYGVYIRNNAQVKGGTTGNQQITGWGPTSSANTKNYGVYLTGTSLNLPMVTTNGGNLSITGTARGAITTGSDVSAGVVVDAGAVVSASGSGTVSVIGTGGANAGGGNVGVLVKGAGSSTQPSTITSGGGSVTVIGNGGGKRFIDQKCWRFHPRWWKDHSRR